MFDYPKYIKKPDICCFVRFNYVHMFYRCIMYIALNYSCIKEWKTTIYIKKNYILLFEYSILFEYRILNSMYSSMVQ